ncbi:SMC-Scp complex subunit ScpB [bacterium]|nr:SMC-Scp complex subunit ScpB [bacterium]
MEQEVKEQLKSKVEAVLFITSRAMQPDEIAQILEVDVQDIEEALLDLVFDYSSRNGALEIDDEDGYIIQVKSEHLDIVEKLCPVELSPAVIKTLTVIALKEPIRQTTLKELRPSAYEHITQLLEQGLISRTKDKNGRSFNIRTTKKFKEYFKLKGDIKALVQRLDTEQDLKNL